MGHHFDLERERLRRRIGTIAGTPLAKELRRYRNGINKLASIKSRAVRGFSVAENRPTRWRAEDEVKLCHRFLDQHGIATMYEE